MPGRVHYHDAMLADDSAQSIEDYLRAARSAIDNLDAALQSAGRSFDDVASCLDFGCGHGRVLRLLQQRIPARRITVCDVDEEGVYFCAAEFGARPLVSRGPIASLRLGRYDLVWSGSVFTHLDRDDGEALLEKLGASLLPGGVLVFTFHGEQSLGHGVDNLYDRIYASDAEAIRREVASDGFAFRPYERTPDYGMSWHTREYLEAQARRLFGDRLVPVLWRPAGWDNHHDVIAFQAAGG